MPEIQVDWHSQQEADRLRNLRDRHGMVWRGVLLEGAKHAESIDLLKALTELHPALATTLPSPTGAERGGLSRPEITEQLREEIRERQRIRATTEIPISAFGGDGDGDSDDDTDAVTQRHRADNSDHTAAPERGSGQPPQFDADRARAYERWDVREARAIEEGELLHPHSAHEDVRDVLRHERCESDHPDEDDLDEWRVYDDYHFEYGGEY
ncbi:hypothetical protein [Haloplanus halophilus]|uniref:hypothetical protein n=1 Tax=Haloplanus halophilus TaxID=2949993 RepID=UPI00203C97E7|nr:hypothetical protein [Haloplanus sp. GDY1]